MKYSEAEIISKAVGVLANMDMPKDFDQQSFVNSFADKFKMALSGDCGKNNCKCGKEWSNQDRILSKGPSSASIPK